MSGAAGFTSRRTMTLLMVAATMSFVAREIVRSTSVTTRPTEAAPVTMIPVPAKFGQFEPPVGVSGDDEVDLAVEARDHVGDRGAARVVALVEGRLVEGAGGAALVEQDDDRLDALLP